MNTNISVLMSLYKKENPKFLRESLNSILSQTLLPQEIVIILDGPITVDLQNVLNDFMLKKPDLFRVLPQKSNKGLGISLAIGVNACKNELIARMDTDDIMVTSRFKMQVQQFIDDSNLSICGGNITEFTGSIDNVLGHRNVPETNEEIRYYSRKRNPFNHMSVMFKKSRVIDAGNYLPMNGFEDYYLWARMLKSGNKSYNIPKNLVFARTGTNMYRRRGGWKYLKDGVRGRYYICRAGLSTPVDFILVEGVHIVVSLLPNKLRQWFYETKLRN